MNLDGTIVLYLDCQTTGASTRTGELIEIGWARSDLINDEEDDDQGIEVFVVKPSDDKKIPARVKRVTGISQEEIDAGVSSGEVWQNLMSKVDEVALLNSQKICPVVIHYAKFELPFLRQLHKRFSPDKDFSLNIICTHEISRRLFPALPRRGVRALAGYFGFPVGEKRRCSRHIKATAVIWKNIVNILMEKHDVGTFEQLLRWMRETPIHAHKYRGYPMDARELKHLPDKPGVYRMLRSSGGILYIGKATSIKKRVQSYFRKRVRHSEHILEMLSQVKKIDVTETGSVLEAALLESDEIKHYTPPYNIALKQRERGVWFCTSDFKKWNDSPGRKYRIGPFVRKEPVYQLAVIRDLLLFCQESEPEDLHIEFDMAEEYAPGVESVKQGCEMFIERNAEILSQLPVRHAISKLGKILWSVQRTDLERDDFEGDDGESKEHKWSPSSVVRLIERSLFKGTHALRMSRWLVWLSESSVAWHEKGIPQGKRILLVFEEGNIVQRSFLSKRDIIPVPPGHRKSFNERQDSFNLMTIDRLRITTTEMRKLISAGHPITVRFSKNIVLENDILKQILAWV